MEDRNTYEKYTKKTIEMYESLLKFRDELVVTKDNRKKLKGLTKNYKDNWDRHVRARGIIGSDLDKRFKSVQKQIEVILYDISINESELGEVRTLVTILDELDSSEIKLKTLIKDILNSVTKELDGVRTNIENKVKISEIIQIEKRNCNERLLKDMSLECISRANRLQDYFNRVVDAVEILEELNGKEYKHN